MSSVFFFIFSMILLYILPKETPLEYIASLRYYSLFVVYFLGIWIAIFSKEWLGIVVAISVEFCIIAASVPFHIPQIPNYLYLWLSVIVYVVFLSNIRILIPLHAYLIYITVSWCCLFCLPYIPTWIMPIALHIHPGVLISLSFPNYDYLRGPFLYTMYPITSNLGMFHYPIFWHLMLGYFGVISITFFLCKKICRT